MNEAETVKWLESQGFVADYEGWHLTNPPRDLDWPKVHDAIEAVVEYVQVQFFAKAVENYPMTWTSKEMRYLLDTDMDMIEALENHHTLRKYAGQNPHIDAAIELIDRVFQWANDDDHPSNLTERINSYRGVSVPVKFVGGH